VDEATSPRSTDAWALPNVLALLACSNADFALRDTLISYMQTKHPGNGLQSLEADMPKATV
jgi:hypothetical protein